MMRVRANGRSMCGGMLLVVFGLAAGCGDLATSPGSPGSPIAVALTWSQAGGPGDAFDRADGLALRLLRDGGTVVRDTVVPFSSSGEDVRIRLRVDPDDADAPLTMIAELRLGQSALFTGQAAVVASGDGLRADITLEPVIARIEPPSPSTLDEIGGSLQLAAAAVFATGDTIPGVTISFRLLDQGIVDLAADGTVRALKEGTARVEAATGGGITAQFTVIVRLAVGSVLVSPNRVTLLVGGRQQFTVRVFDLSGSPLAGRTANWTSSNANAASIDNAGLAQALAAGSSDITVLVDGVTGIAVLTVVTTPPPAAPTNLAAGQGGGTSVPLTWNDNATNESSYEIYRAPPNQLRTSIATLAPNATSYTDGTAGEDQVFEYSVAACVPGACGESAVIEARTVPKAAAGLTLMVTDSAARTLRLQWQDGSAAETRFEIQVFDSLFTGQWVKRAEVPANTTQYDGNGTAGTLERFRVVACNNAGCSAPTNTVQVQFALVPPTVVTLPSVTGTDMRGFVDGFTQPFTAWFEFSTELAGETGTTSPQLFADGDPADVIYAFTDVSPNQTYFYRIYAQNQAGTSFGAIEMLTTPDLTLDTPPVTTLCNGVSSCVNPTQATITARSAGPIGTYANPFSNVFFELGIFPRTFLANGTVSVIDDPGAGTRTYVYTATFVPFNLPPDTYYVAVVGDLGPEGGTVHVGYIAFLVDIF